MAYVLPFIALALTGCGVMLAVSLSRLLDALAQEHLAFAAVHDANADLLALEGDIMAGEFVDSIQDEEEEPHVSH